MTVFDTINKQCESVEGGWDPKTGHFKRYKRIFDGKQRVFVSALQPIFVGCAVGSVVQPFRFLALPKRDIRYQAIKEIQKVVTSYNKFVSKEHTRWHQKRRNPD